MEDTFLVSGFDNWKKAHEKFVQHENSSAHKEALLKIQLLKQVIIQVSLNKQAKKDQTYHRSMLIK